MKTIYLAGGMRSGWQKRVEIFVPHFNYIDPCDNGLKTEQEYTFWDLESVRRCDYLFGYMEKDNPSGAGLALEIGYAKGLNKAVFLIDESGAKYFGMARSISDVVFTDFNAGISFLQRLSILDK